MSFQVGFSELLFCCDDCSVEAEATYRAEDGYIEPEDLDAYSPDGWVGGVCPDCAARRAREESADNMRRACA